MSEINVNDKGINARVDWVCIHDTSCGKWVGICNDLSLTVQADDQRELHSIIWESMDYLLKSLVEEKNLDSFLREHGWAARSYPECDSDILSRIPVNIRVEEEHEQHAGAAC